MSSASSVLPSDLVSVEVAAQQVGAHPQTSLTRCTFPVLYPVPAPERGPRVRKRPPTSLWCQKVDGPSATLGRLRTTCQNQVTALVQHLVPCSRETSVR